MRTARLTAFAFIAALGAIAGCSGTSEPTADTGAPDTGASDGGDRDTGSPHCRTDADCSDGTFCNGAERCLGDGGGDARGCAPATATTPCTAGQTCDEANDRCVTTCTAHDADGDGHESIACGGDDCDDADPHRYPGNTEVCAYDPATMMRVDPTHDEDCNPMSYANGASGDGDLDMDGFVDGACANTDDAGHTYRGLDCADTAPVMAMAPFTGTVPAASIHPTEGELCNGVDDDCNGMVDDGLMAGLYYPDCDGDNFGDASATGVLGCRGSLAPCNGHAAVLNNTDCNDRQNPIHPGALEECDGIDNDCSGMADEPAATAAACASHYPSVVNATLACNTTTHACELRCTAPFLDCDHQITTGCEIDPSADAANCGACGNACPVAATCAASACEHITRIDAGADQTCALYGTSGHLVCWGRNHQGQLGDGTNTDQCVAVPVAPPAGGVTLSFTQFDAGGWRHGTDLGLIDTAFTCGVTTDGVGYCWGQGADGEVGSSVPITTVNAPTQVAILPSAYSGPMGTSTSTPTLLEIHTGDTFAVGIQREGFLRTGSSTPLTAYTEWGWGTRAPAAAVPTPVLTRLTTTMGSMGPSPFRSYATGPHTVCMVYANGTVECNGSAVGLPSGWTQAAEVSTNAIDIYAASLDPFAQGGGYTCIRGAGTAAGQVVCGAPIPGLTDATQVCAAGRSACALRAGGTVQCWGNPSDGTLAGGGAPVPRPGDPWPLTPFTIPGLTNVTQITCGSQHVCALRSDHTVWCWGTGLHGELGAGTMPVVIGGVTRDVCITGGGPRRVVGI
jgi:hypothetical protein